MIGLLQVIGLSCLGAVCFVAVKRFRSIPSLPGPKGPWLWGHTFRVPKKKPWETFWQWSKEHGPLYQIIAGGKRIIIINTFQVANDLFNKRSATFSNRPYRLMGYLTNYIQGLGLLPHGRRVRETRKLLHSALNARAAKDLHPLQESETQGFLARVLQDPTKLRAEIRRLSSSSMLAFTLGYRVQSDDDPLVSRAEIVAKNISMMLVTGHFWVDFFPFLRRLPLWAMTPFIQRSVHKFRRDLDALLQSSDEYLHRRSLDPYAQPSFMSRLLQNLPNENVEEYKDIVRYANVSLYGGAVDTMIASLDTFYVAMLMYPEVQKKAQAEIDAVIGNGRLPSQADRPSLPYVDAIVKEIFRWNPSVPLTTRVLEVDEQYGDLLLPRGSQVVANIWAMTHEERLFPDPHVFRPERFYNVDEKQELDVEDINRIAFGFGRRICPGMHYANSAVWIAVCMSLAVFDVSPLVGSDGIKKSVSLDCEQGILMWTGSDFDYRLRPRSALSAALLEEPEA